MNMYYLKCMRLIEYNGFFLIIKLRSTLNPLRGQAHKIEIFIPTYFQIPDNSEINIQVFFLFMYFMTIVF
jgi:hypothetical protein